MTKKKSLVEEYLEYHELYVKKYGKDKAIVLMQKGQFYETYATEDSGPNLATLSELTNITRTRANKSINKIDISNPYLLGFNIVYANKYIKMLVDSEYTVIIVDQVTLPPNAKREVTHIYSSGTYIDGHQKPDNNYMICLYIEEEIQNNNSLLLCSGMSGIDITTGKTSYYEEYSTKSDNKYALDETIRFINTINPSEVILIYNKKVNGMEINNLISYLELTDRCVHHKDVIDEKYYKITWQNEFFKKIYPDYGNIQPIEYLELEKYIYTIISFTFLLEFVSDHDKNIINKIAKPKIFFESENLILGNNAIYQLNIVDTFNQISNKKYKSLFKIVDNTSTNMGKRLLKNNLISPITNIISLNEMYDCTTELLDKELYLEYEQNLREINDLERLERKISLNIINPFELATMINSYKKCLLILRQNKKTVHIREKFKEIKIIKDVKNFIEECESIFKIDELKKYTYNEIGIDIFKSGICIEIDKLQEQLNEKSNHMENLREALSRLIATRSKKNIITNNESKNHVKILKNDRDGYYLSLTKLRADSLKNSINKNNILKVGNSEFDLNKLIFKEATKSSTKIIFPHLEDVSDDIIDISKQIQELSKKTFTEKVTHLYNTYKITFKNLNIIISFIDFIKSNATTAKLYNYTRPVLEKSDASFIECEALRHPIIERIIDYEYIPHNICIGKDLKGMLIYGLNSVGKSSLMKEIGICIIMAQAGLFVPATKCIISPYKSIYTRITGNDNIYKGLSSFELEMLDLRAFLKRADEKTLVIGDEVCRGTEYISGNSIVAATIIKLSEKNSNFIFATHLHEIANMKRIKELKNVKSFHLSVDYDIENDNLIFNRQLKEGSGEQIYGIKVAKYIINDFDFINLANEIKNELLQDSNSLLSGKTSKYNSQVFIHECQICHQKNINGFISNLQTHHINFQKNCKDGFVIDKPHMKINDKANLIILCILCHEKIHKGEINLEGYVMTIKGKKIKKNN
jgi:DNA mismatch repair protein MutS